jgi:hydrogenase expression/formation protein HypE
MRRGEIDGIVINTAGVGMTWRPIHSSGALAGDVLILTGTIGDHGMAVMAARNQLRFDEPLRSDVAPLNGLVRAALRAGDVHAMKDPTRGGVASALHEIADKARVGILLHESAIPVRPAVRAAADLLGIDPLFIANEGKAILVVHPTAATAVIEALRAHPYGRDAAAIGECVPDTPGVVFVDTGFGQRRLSEPEGELLPRIC